MKRMEKLEFCVLMPASSEGNRIRQIFRYAFDYGHKMNCARTNNRRFAGRFGDSPPMALLEHLA